MPKLKAGPKKARASPATAGPMTRARLKLALFRAMALTRSRRGTSSAAKACRTGISTALTKPSMVASTMTCQICTTPVTVRPNRMLACSAATTWVTIRILRLSTRSASTPPSGARIMAGRNCSASTVPSCSGVPPSSRTSHGWLTDCIQVPMRLTICPVQKRRKFRCRRAAMPRRKAEAGAGAADSSGGASSAPTSLRRGGRLPSGRRVSSGPDIVSNANK